MEAILGHLGRLGGHLGRLGGILEAMLGHLGAVLGRKLGSGSFYGWPAGRAEAPGGVLLGKETKQKPRGSSTPGTPVINQQGAADLMAFGLSRHRAWVMG